MNNVELAKRIFDCLSDGYDDEEYRKETGTELYNELTRIDSDSIIKYAFVSLCEKIEECQEK